MSKKSFHGLSMGDQRVVYHLNYRENEVELLQRYRRDRRVLLDFILAGSLIKKVVMPPGAVSLDDVDLDQVSVDYVINCAKKGDTLDRNFICFCRYYARNEL